MLERQAAAMQDECSKKPKLKTFTLFNVEPPYTYKHLNFQDRLSLVKSRLGYLPIHLDTGRYEKPRRSEADRVSLVYNSVQIESEEHFLFRHNWHKSLMLTKSFETLDLAIKLKCILNNP